ncbi:copper-transporting ATPase RAN1 [Nannizzia gypsea CBS 118893]|uniref:Copper-transporting ATPase RAN1 n=1 Tax=Arthroderma gypseum (strain ATCC MYA-4604 / CBS 118893) TaxID=535722 RepID=E5R1V2_ARTGP|nr:copper-transporting ATPase RAN1 [Nannizzia gypsea CBS 118893]EFQ98586.1 copper-transporting ATPase RAN1 [Nannizzia gypsea CBS 118893]
MADTSKATPSCCRSGSPKMPIPKINIPSEDLKTTLLVNNIHCASCVAYAKEVLYGLPDIKAVEITILAHEVAVIHGSGTNTSDLVKALSDAAFEVYHADTYNESGVKVGDLDTSSSVGSTWLESGILNSPQPRKILGRLRPVSPDTRKTRHIENCLACREEFGAGTSQAHKGDQLEVPHSDPPGHTSNPRLFSPISRSAVTPAVPPSTNDVVATSQGVGDEIFEAQLSIGGMTCASCANAVTTEIKSSNHVVSVTVSLLTNSAEVSFHGPRENIEKIATQVKDIGFEASVEKVSVKSSQAEGAYVANISIKGMTCSSCVGSVTRALDACPYISNATIHLLGNSGRIEFQGKENLEDIISRIDDLGFEAAIVDCKPLRNNSSAVEEEVKRRTIQIKVEGMFCPHCPQKVLDAVREISDGEVTIIESLTLEEPILTLSYTPNSPIITIRNIIATIDGANEVFRASVYHPPTIEDRSRAMQMHEQKRLLIRLLFTFVVSIPEFLIGILWMSIVPKSNDIRKYLEEPMWIGSVSRAEWALFILTTPVMFFGTDVFHARAFKEIRALWRPGSRVPIFRRFYRFGSMNMLISAGTMVAYFASLAVLILKARIPASGHELGEVVTYFDTVVFLTFFILVGRSLEAYSKAKTGDAVAMLGKLRPSDAILVLDHTPSDQVDPNNSSIQRVPVDLLDLGDIVVIPHGGSPPADGIITGTESYKFDESSLTGESMAVTKSKGDKVFSGSVNVGRPVSIEITDLGSTSMLDQIVAVVREGQAKRAPVERVADAITGYFVPMITLIAISTFIIWLSLGQSGVLPPDYLDSKQGGWPFWSLQFAIAVFVVACPCGLALAAPTALFVGGGLAAKRGILVRGGGEAFQEASRLDSIVFDKTGTLTEGGALKVSDHEVLISDEMDLQIAWALGRALEESSTHPIARAIVEFCADKTAIMVKQTSVEEIPGHGMKGAFTVHVDGSGHALEYEASIGNQRLVSLLCGEDPDLYFLPGILSRYHSTGKSSAILSIRKTSDTTKFVPAIIFATSDPLRHEAAQVVSQLQARNIDVHMCTGDNAITAHAVASVLRIPRSNVMANVLPSQKAEYIKKVQNNELGSRAQASSANSKTKGKRNIVAFVGDGTNDSPALAAADVSIAMASGSDVAVNTAGFILLNSDLNTILDLCKLSRRVFNRVRWNFLWAAIYNVSLIPVAAGVFYPIVSGHSVRDGVIVNNHWRLDPVWAALAMALSSVSVVCSSLALRVEFTAGIGRLFKRAKR